MPEAYVIDAVRTAVGKRNGALAGIQLIDLGALGWRGLLDRINWLDADAAVEDVERRIMSTPSGARPVTSPDSPGLPPAIPKRSPVSRWGSGSAVPASKRFPLAHRQSWPARLSLIVAGGVQNMSQIPISSAMTVG